MNREEMLKECQEIVTKHRQSSYGTPEDNFGCIADLWSVYLQHLKVDVQLKGLDVANMMILLKIARLLNDPTKEDNWIDIAGYAACGCEVATKNKPNPNIREVI